MPRTVGPIDHPGPPPPRVPPLDVLMALVMPARCNRNETLAGITEARLQPAPERTGDPVRRVSRLAIHRDPRDCARLLAIHLLELRVEVLHRMVRVRNSRSLCPRRSFRVRLGIHAPLPGGKAEDDRKQSDSIRTNERRSNP